jgi:hypothetical protein
MEIKPDEVLPRLALDFTYKVVSTFDFMGTSKEDDEDEDITWAMAEFGPPAIHPENRFREDRPIRYDPAMRWDWWGMDSYFHTAADTIWFKLRWGRKTS